MSDSTNPEKPVFRLLADVVTDSRPVGVAWVCSEIIRKPTSFRSYKLAGRLGVALATDAADGWLARYSNIPSVEGARKDQIFDKLSYSMLMYSLAYATDDSRYLKYEAVNSMRNVWTEHRREQLRVHGLPAGARRWGRLKTQVQDSVVLLDVSPFGESHPEIVHDLHLAATGLAIVSGIDIELDARRKLSATNRRGYDLSLPDQPAIFAHLKSTIDEALAV